MASGASYLTGKNLLRRAKRGLYAGRMILFGNQISEDGGNRSRRRWLPNVHKTTMYSDVLDRRISLRCTAHALRCIDKAGGLDAYILNTPDKKLGSDVGAELRREMLAAKMVPPPHRASRTVRQPVQPPDSQGGIGQQPPALAPG